MGSLGPSAHEVFVSALQVSLVGVGFDFRCDCLSYHLCASPLPLDMGCVFFGGVNILLLMVVQQLLAILDFSQEKMKASFYSTIFLEGVICILLFVICVICYFFYLHSNKLINDKLKLPFLP